MEQSKERPVFTEHPPMSKIIRAEATKFPVLDQAQPESAKKLYDAFHDNTDDTVERYDNKRFSVCGIINHSRRLHPSFQQLDRCHHELPSSS